MTCRTTLIATFFLLSTAACARTPARSEAANRLFVFVDETASVTAEQRALWRQSAQDLVQHISQGWEVRVFPIHDQSLAAAPLIHASVPFVPKDAGVTETMRGKKALQMARKAVDGALEQSLKAGRRAQGTDLFGAIDRIKPSENGKTVVVFFSDMLNSSRELNLERDPLRLADTAAILQSLAFLHGWDNQTLRGAAIYCVLNAVPSGRTSPGPDRRSLKRFYEALFHALGARLVVFDTFVPSWDLSTKGATHAGN